MRQEIVAMTLAEARTVTEEIRIAASMTWELVIEAHERQAWKVLGYPTWAAYCEGEFQSSRLRLPRPERTEVVAALAHAGMTVREIASATGESRSTVGRELKPGSVPNGTRSDAWEGIYPPDFHRTLGCSDEEWERRLQEARAVPDDADALLLYSSVSAGVVEAAIALCRAVGDLSAERLKATLRAVAPEVAR